MNNTTSLKKNYEFQRIFKKGRFQAGKYIVIYTLPNGAGINKLGVTTGKKFGSGVRRNRIRRLLKENYRLIEDYVFKGFDIVFVARPVEVLPDFYEVKKEMKYLMNKLNLFDKEKWNCSKERLL